MIDYNLILYVGLFLLIFGFILFVVSEIRIRQIDKELFRQEQLHKSFMKAKKEGKWNITLIKKNFQ